MRKNVLLGLGSVVVLVIAVIVAIGARLRPQPITLDPPLPNPAAMENPLLTVVNESSASIPLSAPLDELQAVINERLPRTFNDQVGLPDASACPAGRVRNVRMLPDLTRGGITLTPAGDRVNFSTQIRGKITVKVQLIPLCIGGGAPAQETIENLVVTVHGWVRPRLNEDWSLAFDSDATIDCNNADVRLFNVINIGVRSKVEDIIRPKLPGLFATALAEAGQRAKLRDKAAGAWSRGHVAAVLSPDPKVTVHVTPAAVAMKPLAFGGDRQIRATGKLSARFAAYAGADAPTAPAPQPLPNLHIDPSLAPGISAVLPIGVRPSGFDAAIRAQLIGFKVKVDDRNEIKITDAGLKVIRGNVYLKAGLETTPESRFKLAGHVYLAGTPAYDATAGTLTLKDVQFEVQTKNKLAQLAAWLLNDRIVNELQARATFNVKSELEKARVDLNKQIADAPRPTGVQATLDVQSVAVPDLRFGDDVIYALFTASGQAEVAAGN